MPNLPIVLYPDEVLTTPSVKVSHAPAKLAALIADMIKAMHKANGVGLAAPQIGQGIRLCVLEHVPDRSRHEEEEAVPLQILINPKILSKTGGEEFMEEGCLSLPNVEVNVPRARKVKVRATDEHGNTIQFRASGFHARIIQHELDHLEGRLIIDYAKNKKDIVKKFHSHDA